MIHLHRNNYDDEEWAHISVAYQDKEVHSFPPETTESDLEVRRFRLGSRVQYLTEAKAALKERAAMSANTYMNTAKLLASAKKELEALN